MPLWPWTPHWYDVRRTRQEDWELVNSVAASPIWARIVTYGTLIASKNISVIPITRAGAVSTTITTRVAGVGLQLLLSSSVADPFSESEIIYSVDLYYVTG
ncbi:hypothetical protein IFM61606_00950 [Aspergillus udagawae]|uniref:Uncharacterized protein n=1 Tax=Aspergillus udagawae TaxID=91492 RepID=A0ABQ1AF97_9EURO|nr:hypothetical protein IFM53868_02942 [Aspergillus udagawae]GFG05214.1 hypothetical protein IFM5058_02312 [Aspergillus udagawae]GFG21009.1 hypothetical protein IFM61606_00950 [Aspergillus udagawae]